MRFALVLATASFALLGCATVPTPRDGPGETAGRYLDDAAMTASVNTVIISDADARYFKIDVSTTQGVVTLHGTINNRDAEERLLTRIRAMRGVKSVNSQLRIETSAS